MRTLKVKPINNFIVISDVHLREPDDNITQLFLKTLDNILNERVSNQKKIDALFLLGDIFDFITGSKKFFLKMWKSVFEKFKQLKESGIQVYFIEGNHDFGFEHFRSKKLDEYFTNYGDCSIEFIHEKTGNIVLRHGDDLICPEKYIKFRQFVKSKFFQKITSFLFAGFFMHFLFSRYAKASRLQDVYRKIEPNFIKTCLDKYFLFYMSEFNKKINILIIGHIHVFINTYYKDTHILVGPDWFSAPNYLYYNEDGVSERVYCDNKIQKEFQLNNL
ncbi:UDP-2,3-diacylglucosamine diphosphatase [Fluviispira multicolorata]|uniref:UDP-2,3-diacylglucosamine diphosphatase n=1 Tax=Fluviispira multicolorata TaxID=2654512 RepID=UPI00137619B2|nr:metallophosphoesterase [Fluviispira multicolorata]